jgi:LmbE family N-acetylglucosaminyl deacetylase
MRLRDGQLPQLWATTSGAPFWVTPKTSETTVDSTVTYTRAQAISTVRAIITGFSPTKIATLDSTFAYGPDEHTDHVASGLFVLEAAHGYTSTYELKMYRGYTDFQTWDANILNEARNLSQADHDEKVRIMVAYGATVDPGGLYDEWIWRRYVISRVWGGTSTIAQGTKCLDVSGGAAVNNAAVVGGNCSGAASQNWNLLGNGQIVGIGGLCLTVGSNGSSVQISTCSAGSTSQGWSLMSNGQLRGVNGTCLTLSGSTMSAALCQGDTSTKLGVPVASQRWVQAFGTPTTWSSGSNFSDTELSANTNAATFQLADINADGRADACARRSDGLYCALNSGNQSFAAETLVSAQFADASGWQADAYGTTVQLGDLDGDGRADVCGRKADGIYCAVWSGSTLGAPTRWSTDFTDAAGFGSSVGTYGTLRLADVNGDGRADVCERGSAGMYCALNTGGAFGASALWSSAFSDAAGWSGASAVILMGDLNGDGRADVCGRTAGGVSCALAPASGTGFGPLRLWSLRSDFSDAAGWGASAALYGSLRLADVTGDGYADLCGRATTGVVCAISNGLAFDGAAPLGGSSYSDAQGWNTAVRGSSIRFADLNQDGRPDVCGRSASGVVCALAASTGAVAAPTTPTIVAASPVTAGATGLTAQVTAHAGMTYTWTISGGTITSAGGTSGVTASGSNTITYTAGAAGTITLTCVERNATGASSSAGTATVTVNPATPSTPAITAPAQVTAGATGQIASVTARPGMTYVWTISGATITSAGATAGVTSGSTNSITFTAGTGASIALGCAESNGVTTSTPGNATVTIVPAPVTPTITAPASANAGATGVVASVTAHSGMTYVWTIAGGTITSAGGTSGVTSGGTNSLTFTAGASGTVSLTCAERNSLGATSATASATVTINASSGGGGGGGGGTPGTGHLYVVAHPDDDLLFMNPDIENALLGGHAVRTVYVTSGDAGNPASYWQAREDGIRNANAAMAGVANTWNCGNHTYAGKTAILCTLPAQSLVSVVFLRLPDGGLPALWATDSGPPFWVTPVASENTVDGVNTYTRSDLINVLSAIMTDVAPQRLGTLDSTLANGDDHTDHVTSGMFALEAVHAYGSVPEIKVYRGYSMFQNWFAVPTPMPRNLTTAQHNEKTRLMTAYGSTPATGDLYDEWCWRQYFTTSVTGGPRPLTGSGNRCIDVSGSAATASACSGASSQNWTVQANGDVVGAGGMCLAVASGGSSLSVATCAGSPQQKWTLLDNGQLRGAGATCLTLGDDNVSLSVGGCQSQQVGTQLTVLSTQHWTH